MLIKDFIKITASKNKIIVFDDFNRADNLTEIGTTTSGHTWDRSLEPLTVWGITSGELRIITTASVRPCIFINSGLTAKRVSMDLKLASSQPRLMFRLQDMNYCFFVLVNNVGTVFLNKIISGVSTTLFTSSTGLITSGNYFNIMVQDDGSTIKLYVDGVLKSTLNNQTELNTSTKCGISSNTTDSASQKTFRGDNFKIETIA
jgi:hypothetical protein